MKNIFFLTTTPTVGGNGDALMEAAMSAAQDAGAEIHHILVRNKQISFCKGCYSCAATGECVQRDGFQEILARLHEAEAVMIEAPIYYNCAAAQALTVVNRLCCTFACKSYQLGPKKKVGVMLTCTGSDVKEMKRHIRNITTLPSVHRAISDERIEVFTGCSSASTCRDTPDYLRRARELGRWAAE